MSKFYIAVEKDILLDGRMLLSRNFGISNEIFVLTGFSVELLRVEGWGLRDDGWWLRVQSWGLRVESWGLRIEGKGRKVEGWELMVEGWGFEVRGKIGRENKCYFVFLKPTKSWFMLRKSKKMCPNFDFVFCEIAQIWFREFQKFATVHYWKIS